MVLRPLAPEASASAIPPRARPCQAISNVACCLCYYLAQILTQMAKGASRKLEPHFRGRTSAFVLGIFFILLLGSVAVWQIVQVLIVRTEQQLFLQDANRVERLIAEATNSAVNDINAFKVLFQGSEKVTFDEYDRAYRILVASSDTVGIVGSSFTQFVLDKDKAAFEKEMRQEKTLRPEGFPNYTIYPTGTRAEYLPIVFYEPYEDRVAPRHGFDILTEPARKAATEKARDTGLVVVTREIEAIESKRQTFVFYAAVYRNGLPLDTVQQRRDALQGVLSISLESQQFFDTALDALRLPDDIDIELFDGDTVTEKPFYDRDEHTDLTVETGNFQRDIQVPVADRVWTARVAQTQGVNPLKNWTSSIVLAIGLLLSLLVSFSVRDLLGARSRALSTAQDMIKRLRAIQQDHDEIVEGSIDPIIVLDIDGRVRTTNQAFEQSLGYKRGELTDKFFAETGLVPPPSLPVMLKNFADSAAGNSHAPYTLLLRHKDGSESLYEVLAHPMKHEGKVIAVQKIFRPISERSKLLGKVESLDTQIKETNQFIVAQERKIVTLEQENAELKQRLARQG
jgi:PAS domain S-box-containing protein